MLKDLRVLNTRPKAQLAGLSQDILAAGGQVLECPTLEIVPTATTWLKALPALHQLDYALFVSPNAVHCFFSVLSNQGIPWPSSIKIIAQGQATSAALQSYGLVVYDSPTIADSEHVLECLQTCDNNHSLLLCRGQGGLKLIENQLSKQGLRLSILELYTRHLPKYDPIWMQALWQKDLVDVVLLTSEQSLRNLCLMLGEVGSTWLQQKPVLVISPRLADIAKSLGLHHISCCQPQDIIQGLQRYVTQKQV